MSESVNARRRAGAYEESLVVIEVIETAWREGRTIVPLLGAGISIESGMPSVVEIIRYLAMLRRYIDHAIHRPAPPKRANPEEDVIFGRIDKGYKEHPIAFVHDHGWPDRFGLRQEVYEWFYKKHPDRPGKAASWIDDARDEFVEKSKPWQFEKYRHLRDTLKGTNLVPPNIWEMLGDWRVVIRDFTEFNPDDADSLLERLYRGRAPGRCHQFWAFLTRLMGLRLFLTINFDPLLERALRAQGIEHLVYGVEHGEKLPHASLVRESVAIIKLHGDTHNLLLDEKLDYPPDREYLDRLDACLPHNPLLVVMGCGGNDPRILKIVEHVARKHGRNDQGRKPRPGALWLHFENFDERSRPLQDRLGGLMEYARVTNPGLFLSHLYARLNSQHPASRVAYPTHISHPFGLRLPKPTDPDRTAEDAGAKQQVSHVECFQSKDAKVVVFSSLRYEPHPVGGFSASSRLAEFVYTKYLTESYIPIWIGLEAHHSVNGVIDLIIEQCRTHDTYLAPFVVPDDDPGSRYKTTCARLRRALQRGRYILAFDGIETFSWPPTRHHGVPARDASRPDETEQLAEFLVGLIVKLIGEDTHDTILCMSIDHPKARRGATGDGDADGQIKKVQDRLIKEATLGRAEPRTDEISPLPDHPDPPFPGDANALRWNHLLVKLARPETRRTFAFKRDTAEPEAIAALVLLLISTFRRPRHLVALRNLLRPFLVSQQAGAADAVIEMLTQPSSRYLIPVEGGGFRMVRALRNTIYAAASHHTRTRFIRDYAGKHMQRAALGHGAEAEAVAAAVQSYWLGSLHERIARYYYAENYLMSSDPWVFLEYAYHRASSIRYLTRLQLLDKILEPERSAKWRTLAQVLPPEHSSEQEWSDFLRQADANERERWLHDKRLFLLQSFLRALEHVRLSLPVGASAGQLTEWCHGVLKDDLGFHESSGELGHSKFEVASFLPKWSGDRGEPRIPTPEELSDLDSDELKGCIRSIRRVLFDMCRRYYYELGDFPKAIKNSWDYLRILLPDICDLPDPSNLEQVVKALGETLHRMSGEPSEDRQAALAKIVLDISACIYEGYSAVPESLHRLLDAMRRTQLSRGGDPRTQENRLRALCMLIEHKLPLPDGKRFTSVQARGMTDQQIEALKIDIEKGLNEIRTLGPERIGEPRRDSFYLRYRTRLLQSKGRLEWLNHGTEAGFGEADRLFELARAGIEPGDHQRLGVLELFWTESLLVRADERFKRATPLEQAHMHYIRAGDALQRARDCLSQGSRTVIWWRRYYQLWAQYQAEWCLWYTAELELKIRELWQRREASTRKQDKGLHADLHAFAERRSGMAARVLKRVKRGLAAIDNGYAQQHDVKVSDPWLRRVSCELLSASTVYGMSAIVSRYLYQDILGLDGGPDLDACLDELSSYWMALNEQVGIPDELRIKFDTMGEAVREAVVGPFPDSTGDWRKAICGQIGRPELRLRQTALVLAEKCYVQSLAHDGHGRG